jgi:predicted PhzF superfamily epimerase YddE/YHI9
VYRQLRGDKCGGQQHGGWFLANGQRGIRRRIHQGRAIQRPSVLDLAVEQDGTILVSGAVREVGRGTFII